jgi:guanine nucleotide exchange factor
MHRRKKIALRLLQEYQARLKLAVSEGNAPYKRILLIAHEELIPLYCKAGFEFVGESAVKHGSQTWFEMRMIL